MGIRQTEHEQRLEQRWQDQYQEVAEYVREHGNLDGLWSSQDRLMRWIQNQRIAENGGWLTDERRAQLDELGDWRSDRRSGVDRYIAGVRRWLDDHPDASLDTVPAGTKVATPEGLTIPIGYQTMYYRRRQRHGQLDAATRQRLVDELGWPTEPAPS